MQEEGEEINNGNIEYVDFIDDKITNVKCKNVIKSEIDAPLIHRKSERRKFARDIFLVFEEQPSSRRAKGTNKKQTRTKPKFGHLKVEEPSKTKCLLRDFKNEPKCYISEPHQNINRKPPEPPPDNRTASPQNINETQNAQNNTTARVNPIFLWVKQDDTRIVEVRCEDYDKRNRIRITKTTNGWRAIPRTDPSTSRIVKFIQTPLLKVKREVYENQISEDSNANIEETQNSDATENIDAQQGCTFTTDYETVPTKIKKDKKRKKEKKNKNKNRKNKKKPFITDDPDKSNIVIDLGYEKCKENEITNETDVNCNLDTQESPALSECVSEGKEIAKTYQINSPKLQLCPKTGLFLPNNIDDVEDTSSSSANTLVEFINSELDCNKNQNVNVTENLDAETKNLKDLLDDADLLQHCEDNGNSDAELIDSLVKRSCENNLIQESDIIKDTTTLNSYENDLTEKELVVETIPQIIETVADPPKCLSFNEAGEIEGLNEELFQSNNYIETFEKESIEGNHINAVDAENTNIPLNSPISENKLDGNSSSENTPKDLSYKKREEVCPPSESRSQCAVTSSSDIVKSPCQNEIPAIETTSETIKNMILEQFMKLNSINTIPTPTAKQQLEPIDLGKHQQISIENNVNKYPGSSNYIDTVLIDETEDEPVKKRIRNTVNNSVNITENISIIDKDPDPLTQLQLLIRNTQWKVPDPILVPKDRLSAVLASPAREIPLLITTRPELRLPEAFAYPEIIQNPNILVISMAQLEAILKNDVHLEKEPCQANINEFNSDNIRKLNVQQQEIIESQNESKTLQPKEINTKCSHIESSLASDINAATLAVLNQMLWLPYFNQLSQEFLKSVKEPISSQNKYNNLLPIYNHQLGLQHLEELYKNFVNQLSGLKQINTDSNTQNFASCMGAFKNPMELAIFQKIVQHQMHNFLSSNINSLATETAQKDSISKQHQSSSEHSSNVVHNQMDPKRCKKSLKDNTLPMFNAVNHNNVTMASKFKSNCDNTNSFAESSIVHNVNTNKSDLNNKPRLTCKSLSNLLEPENVTSVTVPLVNLTPDNSRNTHESVSRPINKIKESHFLQTSDGSLRTSKVNKNYHNNTTDLSKPRKRNINLIETVMPEMAPRNSDSVNGDTNPALWHPLFGSNAKAGYSSPWQWTTVTATGE